MRKKIKEDYDIYIPKNGKTDDANNLLKGYEATFYKKYDETLVKKTLLFTLGVAGKRLQKEQYLDIKKDADYLKAQDLHNYFYKGNEEKYRGGFFVEGYDLLQEYLNEGKTKSGDQNRWATRRSAQEIGKMMSTRNMLIHGKKNYKMGMFNCANTIVTALGISTNADSGFEYHITSNYTHKHQTRCTFKEQKKNAEHKKKKSRKASAADKNNCKICETNCGKTSCAEQNFLAHTKLESNAINPTESIILINHDEKNFGPCSLCDLELIKCAVPVVINLYNTKIAYCNISSGGYDKTVKSINEIANGKFLI